MFTPLIQKTARNGEQRKLTRWVAVRCNYRIYTIRKRFITNSPSTNGKLVQCKDPIKRINTVNEFGELKSVIIGHTDPNFRFAQRGEDLTFDYSDEFAREDDSGNGMFSNVDYKNGDQVENNGKLPPDLIKRENENLNIMAHTLLNDFGITVYRPNGIINKNIDINVAKTDDWQTQTYMQAHCPRDVMLSVENKLIICPTLLRGRRLEVDYYYQHILDNIEQNCTIGEIIDLRNKAILNSDVENELRNALDSKKKNSDISLGDINIKVPFFDAANILKFGEKRLLYLVSCSGNMAGYKLLCQTLPDYEIIPLVNFYNGFHIDTTICILNKNTMLFNPLRTNYDICKNIFGKYGMQNFISCPNLYDNGYEYYSATSIWIGMNLLSINEEMVVIDKNQHELAKQLKEIAGIHSTMLPFNYARDFGGGPHCVSLDLERES